MTKGHIVDDLVEAALEYVWGVKNPKRVGNQYSIETAKQPIKEKK